MHHRAFPAFWLAVLVDANHRPGGLGSGGVAVQPLTREFPDDTSQPAKTVAQSSIGRKRGRGPALGVEPVQDPETKAPAGATAEAVFYRALEVGLSFKVTMGNVLTLTAPLVISEEDLMRGLDILEACIGEVG